MATDPPVNIPRLLAEIADLEVAVADAEDEVSVLAGQVGQARLLGYEELVADLSVELEDAETGLLRLRAELRAAEAELPREE